MIQRIRNSRAFKGLCMLLVLNLLAEIVSPMQAMALTGGPSQPEFGSFTPVGTSDMVDLSSGDMSYNIPLMDVGGYPLNIAYSSGVGMDDEASWVGLGWNLSVGQINRNVRGLPDDFKGDEMIYENNMKPNVTVGADFKVTPDIFGVEPNFSAEFGVSAMYNNYTGFTLKQSVGMNVEISENVSVGFNAESGPDGLNLSPSASIHKSHKDKEGRNHKLTGTVGVSMNSRQGLTATTLSMSKKSVYDVAANTKEKKDGVRSSSTGSSIGFTDNLYTPSKRVAMVTGSFTVNAALGGEIFGAEGQGQIRAYGTVQKIAESEKLKKVAAYGYDNTDKADKYSVLDFNREKDGAFTKNSTNLPLTNYTYDIYSVQGQGVSGMYRPYRNQVGYVYDTYVQDNSYSGTFGAEFGGGNAFHLGIDFDATDASSSSGVWEDNNYMLRYLKETYDYNPRYEKIHHKNVGDLGVDEEEQNFNQTGRYQPIRVSYIGNKFNRRAVNEFKRKYNGEGNENTIGVGAQIKRNKRQTRNQAIYNITKKELSLGIGYGPCVTRYGAAPLPVQPEYDLPPSSKDHHTAEVQIIRNDGARYIYGLPVYNHVKKEYTFAVNSQNGNCGTGLVSYNHGIDNTKSNTINDHFFSKTTTPGYVHTHLLTSVLSTDYQDRTNNGPTPDDLGSYTKFSYKKKNTNYLWRTPYGPAGMASYNEGLKTDTKDDQGNYVYGEKEMYYIDKIETKTHVAFFFYSPRKDARGVKGEGGGIDLSDVSPTSQANAYKLNNIKLYSAAEYNANPGAAIPIKEVNFVYSYSLCTGIPNNTNNQTLDANELSNKGGKLTLKKIYFTYRNSKMGKYTGYKFNYNEYRNSTNNKTNEDELTPGVNMSQQVINSTLVNNNPGMGRNPLYNVKAYDFWGNYKPNALTSGCNNVDLPTADYSFAEQDKNLKDNRAAVWNLSTISLPSGGNITVDYESDDYASVQDKDALRMFQIAGAGQSETPSSINASQKSDVLYEEGILQKANNYLYVEVGSDEELAGNSQLEQDRINKRFYQNVGEHIHFRFFVNMTKMGGTATTDATLNASSFDYVTGYFKIDKSKKSNIFTLNGKKYLSVPVQTVNREGGVDPGKQVNPIAKAAWQFGRKYLSKHVYSNSPNGDSDDIQAMVTQLLSPSVFQNIYEIFSGPNVTLENKKIGRTFVKNKSWIRLKEPTGFKYGGGSRVKSVRMSDVWQQMNPGQGDYKTMNYGQQYEYNLSETINGIATVKSSGVATYEPVGNKENPFVQPVFSSEKHLLAPDDDNYVEMPFGESFFPNPQVTYSRVGVYNLVGGETPGIGQVVKKLHRTGRVVTEFFTTKDYPVQVDQTILEAFEDKQNALANLLKLDVRKHMTASQGYVIHLNDMNGKQKAQWVYAEGQLEAISGVKYHYDNYTTPANYNSATYPERNKGSLNNLVKVIYPNGDVKMKTIGVEYDVVNDFRANQTTSKTLSVNANLATFFVGIIPGIVPIPLPDVSSAEDKFRSVSTTKVINTFGILKETVAYDAGAEVHTRNLAWDALTGEVLVTETVDEFSDMYYTFNYPAHWYYKGMGQAAENLGFTGTLSQSGGTYTIQGIGASNIRDFLIEGDEIVYNNFNKAWVSSISANRFRLIAADGNPISNASGAFEITRSGHRNLQSAGIMNVTLMRNPLKDPVSNADIANLGTTFLNTTQNNWSKWKIINAGAVDYSDNWPAGCECGVSLPGISNPYLTNSKGVWRTKSSQTYLTGRNMQTSATPRKEGFFNKFSPFYALSPGNNWYKNTANWKSVSEVTIFSPYGFELENKDALNRYSGAQYGYNNTLPMAVGANSKYAEIGYDGFEDYGFTGCELNTHFSFKGTVSSPNVILSPDAHTGKYSLKIKAGSRSTILKRIICPQS